MAPSATEQPQAVDDVQVQVQVKPAPASQKPVSEESLAVQEEQLPELRTNHKEPLKLNGALDQFEHFDVTPVIGREYVDVNLAELLRAPNSDELLRDLAITSKHTTAFPSCTYAYPISHTTKSLADARNRDSLAKGRGVLPQAGRHNERPAERARAAPGRALGQAVDVEAAHPPDQQRGAGRRQGRRDQRHLFGAAEGALPRPLPQLQQEAEPEVAMALRYHVRARA